ncbi:MAG TPA: heparan-alpha-glucosaminide N-acetyltransferase domain-containing protein, partial [Ottowia sp.]|nr:heparan-alpha-glucosaminide N-acetyltransferase domain-containing protein [Ottowia sp.]
MSPQYRSHIPTAGPAQRLQRLDALRGLAMLWMTAFHFAFDL